MPQELLAALIGAAISGALMVLSNRSNRSQGNFREIFHRLNAVETVSYTHLTLQTTPYV